jgi:hypothetical protein
MGRIAIRALLAGSEAMSSSETCSSGEPRIHLRTEIVRAEALLRDIAASLRKRPMKGGTSELHVRALQLKRQVSSWTGEVPDATVRQVVEQVVALHRQAQDALPSCHQGE